MSDKKRASQTYKTDASETIDKLPHGSYVVGPICSAGSGPIMSNQILISLHAPSRAAHKGLDSLSCTLLNDDVVVNV